MITIGPAGVAISSRGELKISSTRNCVVAVDGNLAITSKRRLEISASSSLLLESIQALLRCGSATIDISESGNIAIHGTRVEVKGSGDVVIKGQKLLQN